ncbi:MAG: M56 family metallopeptidase [Phycisphaerae bacterium]|nr:M56 family metallopeptidase [Phycisphaerae bacterium]
MNEYAASLLRYLGQTTIEASLLIGLILVARGLLRDRLSARWQYALWFLVCIKILIPWTPYSPVSLDRLIPSTLASSSLQTALPEPALGEAAPHSTASAPWGLWSAVLIWISGMGAIGIYLLRDYHRMTRLVNHCPTLTARPVLALLQDCCDQLHIRTRVRLVITDAVQSPALLGMIRPKLLLPKSMIRTFTRRQLRHVFLHELAHLKRHDIAASCIASLCHLIHWFNPLVWYAFQQMRTDRELACDQVALTQLAKSEESTLYGQTIIRVLEFNRCHPLRAALAGMGQTRHQVRKRIVNIAEFQPAYEGIHWGAACLLACLAVTGLTRTEVVTRGPLPVQANRLTEDRHTTEPSALDTTAAAPPVEKMSREAVAQNTPRTQEHTSPQPTGSVPQNEFMSSGQSAASLQPSQMGALTNDMAAMNAQMWYQVQLNAMQFQEFQQRLYRQATLQRQQAARQFASQARLQRRRTTPNTTQRRRRTTQDGIAGIVEMAARQATHNSRVQ